MSADVIPLRTSRERSAVAEEEPQPAPFAPVAGERFDLRSWSDGYAIYDAGRLIATFRGNRYDLASKTLRLLREAP